MSADSWAVCPKCQGRGAQEDYGDPPHTVREDYEIGIWDGSFEVIYKGVCRVRDFTYSHKHTEDFDFGGEQ